MCQVVYWVFCFHFMLIIHDNVINVDVQMVSYIFIYLKVGIFSKPLFECLFQVVYWVFYFLFMLTMHDNVINVDVQNVSYIFIYLNVRIFSI